VSAREPESGHLPAPAAFEAFGPPPAELFRRLWDAAAEVIGVGATAVLVKRAAGRVGAVANPGNVVEVERLGLGYRYRLPASWYAPGDPEATAAVRDLVAVLGPLLVELTGSVVVGRLAADPALRAAGLFAEEDLSRWRSGA
jgi:hypothetical protein